MDTANFLFLRDSKVKYPEHFRNCNVLDIGCKSSPNFREFFTDNCTFIGVDMASGEKVDIVCRGQDTVFPEKHFDTMLCFSVFEHDPDWRNILIHNLPFLKDGALIFLCWGAEGNESHDPTPWAIVPEQEFKDFVKTLPLEFVDGFFEIGTYDEVPDPCRGAYDAVLRIKRL